MSATYCPVGNTVSATLLPYGQYAPLLNRHLLPRGQYGVGYAIALWAIRSAGAAMCSLLSRLARIRRAHLG